MRLFVAIELPERLREDLAGLVDELREARADVRWVRAGSMHLTLKFLGDTDAREVGGIDETLRRVARAARATGGTLEGVGSFPHLRRPRVIWAGVVPDDGELATLHEAVDRALGELGFAREKRGFHPHVTLGRVRGGRGTQRLAAAVEHHADREIGRLEIGSMTLFESHLHPDGARHEALGTYRLGSS